MIKNQPPVIDILINRFAEFGEADALVFRGKTLKFSDIIVNLNNVHKTLVKHNIKKGQTIVLKADYCFNSVLILLVLMKIKTTIVPVLPRPALQCTATAPRQDFIIFKNLETNCMEGTEPSV